MIWLMTRGELPSEGQGRLLDPRAPRLLELVDAAASGGDVMRHAG